MDEPAVIEAHRLLDLEGGVAAAVCDSIVATLTSPDFAFAGSPAAEALVQKAIARKEQTAEAAAHRNLRRMAGQANAMMDRIEAIERGATLGDAEALTCLRTIASESLGSPLFVSDLFRPPASGIRAGRRGVGTLNAPLDVEHCYDRAALRTHLVRASAPK